MKYRVPSIFLLLTCIILVINLVQSYFTPLIFDEAYYWHYAQNLAWGYFDHPPLVALMIKTSSFFFEGELGVRFMSCLLSAATFFILWWTIESPKKRDYVIPFFVLTFSMTLFNAYGFFTLPDTPLLFFTAVFLFVYKQFLKRPSWLWAILMGIAMAGLMYSKYHAVLVIFFVLFSNLKLLTNKYAWLSVFVALFCYIPHFLWLYKNDFVTINYHLFNRPNNPYQFEKYTLGYFVNLVAIFGFTFPWIYLSLFKTKASDKFTKALLYLTYGVLLFFFLSSFNRRIQTQWIIIISIPMIIIVFRYMMENQTVNKWILRAGLINILIILYLRVGLVYEPLSPVVYETHKNKEWVKRVHSEIGDIPVVFENSYRNAPMYAFYSGVPTFSLNNDHYRRNQYSIDNSEAKVQHKKVLYASTSKAKVDLDITKDGGGPYFGRFIENFESYRKLRTLVEGPVSLDTDKEQIFQLYNPYNKPVELKKLRFNVVYMTDYKIVEDRIAITPKLMGEKILAIPANDTLNFTFKLPEPIMEHPSYFRIGISENGLLYGINGNNKKLE